MVGDPYAQTRLGHANPRTTLAIYAQADREAAKWVGERFRPRSKLGGANLLSTP